MLAHDTGDLPVGCCQSPLHTSARLSFKSSPSSLVKSLRLSLERPAANERPTWPNLATKNTELPNTLCRSSHLRCTVPLASLSLGPARALGPTALNEPKQAAQQPNGTAATYSCTPRHRPVHAIAGASSYEYQSVLS